MLQQFLFFLDGCKPLYPYLIGFVSNRTRETRNLGERIRKKERARETCSHNKVINLSKFILNYTLIVSHSWFNMPSHFEYIGISKVMCFLIRSLTNWLQLPVGKVIAPRKMKQISYNFKNVTSTHTGHR